LIHIFVSIYYVEYLKANKKLRRTVNQMSIYMLHWASCL